MTNQLSLEIPSPAERRASIAGYWHVAFKIAFAKISPERLDNSPDQSGPPTLEEPGEKDERTTGLQAQSRSDSTLKKVWRQAENHGPIAGPVRELFECEPPSFNRKNLEARLAYRIQELALGGLSDATRSASKPSVSARTAVCRTFGAANMRNALSLARG